MIMNSSHNSAILAVALLLCLASCSPKSDDPSNQSPPADIPDADPFQWTELAPAEDSRMVYVSSSEGDDSNDCLSEAAPCQTLAAGLAKLRDGQPDWLLFKKGDEWFEDFGRWELSGRAEGEPMVVTSYDSGPRPLFKLEADRSCVFMHAESRGYAHLAFVGLHFYAYSRDFTEAHYAGDSEGTECIFSISTSVGQVRDVLVEDNRIEFFKGGVTFVDGEDVLGNTSDIRVRGNVVTDQWTSGDWAGNGCYMNHVDGALLEGNVFDHNAFILTVPDDPYYEDRVPDDISQMDAAGSFFGHNVYLNSGNRNMVVRNNLIAHGDGLHLRAGGDAQDNFFYRTTVGIAYGKASQPTPGGVSGTVRHNVFTEGTDFREDGHTPGETAHGVVVQNINGDGVVIESNLFLDDRSSEPAGLAVSFYGGICGTEGDEVPCKIEQATVRDNFVFNWRGGLQIYGADEDIVEIGFEGNTLIAAEAPLVTLTEDYSGFSTQGNQYRGEDGEGWFRIGETTYMALDEWKVSHEPSAEVASDTLPTAPPTLAGYAQSIGAGETGTDFMLEARQLSRDNYRPEYMATGVNAYFRDQLGHEE